MRFIGSGLKRLESHAGRLKLTTLLCLGVFAAIASAQGQPVNDNFANGTVISGLSGTTSGNNSGATTEAAETTTINTDDNGTVDVTNSIWFVWTAPVNGNVTFDTTGSEGNDSLPMDTVLAAWTGTTLGSLTLIGADDNANLGTPTTSKLTFLAVAGTTYRIAVYVNADTPGLTGSYVLNWKQQGATISGSFQFTANSYVFSDNESTTPLDSRGTFERFSPARATLTRSGGASGAVIAGLVANEQIYTNTITTNTYIYEVDTIVTDTNGLLGGVILGYTNVVTTNYNIIPTYENYNPNNGGYYNRFYPYADVIVQSNFNGVFFTYQFSNNIPFITNPPTMLPFPNPAITSNTASITYQFYFLTTSSVTVSNYISSYYGNVVTNTDLQSTNGFLTISSAAVEPFSVEFPDFEMNVDDLVTPGPVLPNLVNNLLSIQITNVSLDPLEDSTLLPPPTLGTVTNCMMTFLSSSGADLNRGPFALGGGTNFLYGTQALSPTNFVVNFQRATVRCNKPVNGTRTAFIAVTINQAPGTALTAYYRIDHIQADDDDNSFATQAGSDHARPNNAAGGHYIANNDFTSVTGTLTFPANSANPQYIQIPITQDSEVKFDRDLRIELYTPNGVTPNVLYGNIQTCDLTILYTTATAGAVDCFFNPENVPTTSPANNPQPGANGPVFCAAVQPADQSTVIGGDFTGYNSDTSAQQNYIARVNADGSLDTTFNGGNGGQFDAAVEALALDASGNILAAGNFHSYGNNLQNGVARLNPDGTLDGTFRTGFGANGPVLALAIQPADGKILIGGSFTSYNNTNAYHLARLNADGSLDISFNPGTISGGDVNSVSVNASNGLIYIGGSFTNVAGLAVNYLCGLNSDGSLNNTFNAGLGSGLDLPLNAVLVQTNGQILIASDFTQLGGQPIGPGIAQLNTNGTVDPTFNVGQGPDDVIYTMSLQSDGNILVGGIFQNINQTRRVSVARLLPNGWVDTTFMDTAYNQYAGLPNFYFTPAVNSANPVYAVVQRPDGNIIIGGAFASVGGDGEPVNATGGGNVTDSRDVMHPRSNLALLVGGATPGPGNIGLTFNNYSANVSSPTFFVNIMRTNGTLGIISATFEALPLGSGPGYAAYGVDYTLNSTLATWGSSYASTWMEADGLTGPNSREFAINGTFYIGFNNVTLNVISNNNANTILDVGVTAPSIMDSFHLGGENIPLGAALGSPLAPLTIIHNNQNPGIFNFSQPYYYVAENGVNALITVTRSSGTDGKVTVQYATTNGTAFAGTDYTAKSGTLTFNAGVSSQSFSVPISPGTIARPDRVFNVNISNPSGGSLGTITNAQVEIINNNILSGFAEFIGGVPANPTTMGYNTNENSGPALLTIARLGGSSGILSLTVATTNGTAFNGTNYTGSTNTLTWNNGDTSVKTITVPVMDDNVITPNLTVKVAMYNATINGVANTNLYGVYSNALLTVNNTDSSGTAEFTTGSYLVNEYAGYALIPVIRTGGGTGPLSVSYSTSDGTAVSTLNYGATNGTLQFAAGQVSTNIIVAITNLNTTWNTPLYFTVTLSGGSLGTPSVAQVNINGSQAGNNPPGQQDPTFGGSFNGAVFALALQADGKILAGGSFTQSDGVPRRHIARLKTDGSEDLTFSSSLSTAGANDIVRAIVCQTNGLILVGGIFTNFNNSTLNHIARLNVNGSLDSSFVPGAGADNSIYAMAQNYINGQRRIVIGGAFTLYNGQNRSGVAQLMDNGQLDATFAPLTGANGTVYAVAVQPNGQIIIGGDFTSFNGQSAPHLARLNLDGSLDTSFNPGTGPSDSVRALAVQPDGRILVGGLFTSYNGGNANHLIRVNASGSADNTFVVSGGEAGGNVNTITIQPDSRIVVGGDFTIFNGVTRNRITRLNQDGTTDPSINFGYGADSSVLAAVIQPADGKIVLGGFFQNYNNLPSLYIARVNGGSVAGSGQFQFSAGNYYVDERGTNVLITVIRTGGTSGTNASGTAHIIVPFSTSDGTALADTDHGVVTNYLTLATNLDFPPGEVVRSVVVNVLDDGVITPTLTVNLSITNLPLALQGGQPTAVLNIINDDSSISFSSSAYPVPKNVINGVALINLVRLGGTNSTSTVVFATTNGGSATPGTDYTPVGPEVIVFPPGATNETVTIPINNNGLAEGNQTVVMQISAPTNTVLALPTNAVLTIIDNVKAPGQLSFGVTNYLANANAGVATVNVVRSGGSSGTVQASYATLPGTALPGINYTPASGTVTFSDGQTNATFTVPVLNNNQATGPVYFFVTLSNAVDGATLISPTNAYVTVLNTNVVIGFASATNTFAEPTNGTLAVALNVVRFNNTNGTSIVTNVFTTDGTAFSNLNYQASSGPVTFNPGETMKTVILTLDHDAKYTGTVYFNVNLANPGTGVQIAQPNPTVVQITDAEAGLSFTNSALSVVKGSGSLTVNVVCANTNVEPVIVNSNTVPLSVGYYTMDGSAHNGSDYTSVSGRLYFTNGLATNSFSVPILNNGFVNGVRNFNVILTNPTAPGVLTVPSNAVVSIIDNNAGFAFSSPAYSVAKSAGAALINVLRFDNTNITSTVNFIATNGTAVNGLNFTATNGTLLFTNGMTSASFYVPVNDTTVPQPDLTVLLLLQKATNGVLVPPSAATLTIHDNTGAYVVPAGSTLVSESGVGAPNGIIDTNETVTLKFAFRVAGGTNVNNLVARIVPNANVTAVSPATNSYGPLVYHGHSVSRSFTFTAQGTNNQPIAVNFNLYDVTTNNPIGTAVFGYTLGTTTASFTNTAAIVINDNTNASPYPAVISVSGVNGAIVKATVTLNRVYHTSPSDIDALLESPAGLSTLFMAHVGGQTMVTNVVLTFDDAASTILTHSTSATTSTNKPSVILPVRNFP